MVGFLNAHAGSRRDSTIDEDEHSDAGFAGQVCRLSRIVVQACCLLVDPQASILLICIGTAAQYPKADKISAGDVEQ